MPDWKSVYTFFLRPLQTITDAEAEEEAQFVLDHVRPYNITGPVVYDTEEIKWDTYRAEDNTSEEYTKYCRVFCDAVEAAGYEPMIYCNMKWMAFTLDMEELAGYDFWYADYYDVPQCPYDYKIWQYSETGVVPGINGTQKDKEQMFVDILPETEPDDGVAYLSFYLEPEADREKVLADVRRELEEMSSYVNVGECLIEESQTEDVDWVNNWKQYFHQFYVDDILIIPSWEDVKPEDSDKMVIHIDPGTAFGTASGRSANT